MIYCPYTDRDLPEEQASSEHIIPLALGGANGLELCVDAAFNASLGSELDGQLANEFFTALRRIQYDARGHSGKEPWATVRHATYGDDARPAQVRFHRRRGLRVWDAREQKERTGVGTIRFSTTLNVDLPVRFAAKVGLAAGFYAYRDLFRSHVDHHQMRQVMLIDPATDGGPEHGEEHGSDEVHARAESYLDEPPTETEWRRRVLRCFCSGLEGSVVVLLPGSDFFHVTVGILGQFLASVSVPADTRSFPNEGNFHWGHAISVVGSTIERRSWLSCMQQWAGVSD